MWNSGIMHLKKLEPAIKCPEEFIKVAAFTENALSCLFDSHREAINFYLHAIHRVSWTQFTQYVSLSLSLFFLPPFFFHLFVSSHASVTHLSLFAFLLFRFSFPFLSFLVIIIIILVFFPSPPPPPPPPLFPLEILAASEKAAKDCGVLGIWPPTWLRRLYSLLECPDTGYFR